MGFVGGFVYNCRQRLCDLRSFDQLINPWPTPPPSLLAVRFKRLVSGAIEPLITDRGQGAADFDIRASLTRHQLRDNHLVDLDFINVIHSCTPLPLRFAPSLLYLPAHSSDFFRRWIG